MEVARLLQLESEAWASDTKRQLYGTPLIPGFPWYTVRTDPSQCVRRHVVPYYYTFRVFVKGRWIGKNLLDIYSEEHAHHSRHYYEACMQQGRLRRQPRKHHNVRRNCMKRLYGVDRPDEREVMEEISEPVILESGDVVLHTVHRHEIPLCMGTTGIDPIVLAAVRITTYGLLVIHKPAGVPTHAGGRYFMNSCTAMLEYVLAPKRLHAWLLQRDPMLQSIVSTRYLTEAECQELLAYYMVKDEDNMAEYVSIERLPRPCYRLDKVTSGILLLGVSQAATRRVGEALTRKTKQMEEVFLCKLRLMASEDKKTIRVGGVQTIEERTLGEFDVGVRKRYLARVHGYFPNDASHALHSCKVSKENSGDNDHRTAEKDVFITIPTNRSSSRGGDAVKEEALGAVGPSVLLASQLMQFKFRDGDTTEEPPLREEEGKQQREPFYQDAATFCQPLRYFTSGKGQASEGESLVHCVPFSGRMHQIRMHLSDWGHPIIGDSKCNVMEQQKSSFYEPALSQCKNSVARSAEETEIRIYFHLEELPKVFREMFYTHDALCWECSGRLPVACFKSPNGSAIALHAWQYEMDHSLLLATSPGSIANGMDQGVETKNDKESEFENHKQEPVVDDESEEALTVCCSLEDLKRYPDEFVRRKGKSVVFLAPPPSWSYA
ncbi:hypothetical protein MOQ_001019 [Trypanosoma cruzi marinkellei]|uniref:Pseudouridine synthase RsuA/RluA-like domain-containing protein n=1 Tax=Trypanosoma cruzi marinkellei TaxID=85056 RepID=K2MU30_TRYCR|nr:hypothetical protein MOQ_001019 [Trypanosoma cruzi marinkellei]